MAAIVSGIGCSVPRPTGRPGSVTSTFSDERAPTVTDDGGEDQQQIEADMAVSEAAEQ